jgi:hypothetical protein
VAKKIASDVVFSITECFGNLVKLQKQTWEGHILDPSEGHPQMSGYETLVQQVLKDPFEVWEGMFPTSAVFISEALVGPSPEGIRVVVNYRDITFEKGSTTGFVTTAYPIDLVAYPTPRLGRRILKNRR